MEGKFSWFSHHEFEIGEIPNWNYNPFNGKEVMSTDLHWTKLDDFSLNVGDIKTIWELSRMKWLTDLARAHVISKEEKYLDRLNEILDDWSINNQLNKGPQWKCGQETSFRLFQLISTSHLLGSYHHPNESLQKLVFQHLKRIYPNMSYALAQDNNHSTSETAALYIGATWLIKTNFQDKRLFKWKNVGRQNLERTLIKLIQADGSFSQGSVNYHRVVLDTLSFVLFNIDKLGEEPFSKKIKDRLVNLGMWQYKLIFGENGESPNLGHNDGAYINCLHSHDYLDYRPSVQTYFGCLLKKKIFSNKILNETLYWYYGEKVSDMGILNVNIQDEELLDSQYLLLRKGVCKLLMKIPSDRFRSGNDALHIDVWINNICIMRDNGTYSYNHELSDKFSSVSSHNTIQFGDHQQMPKISRFLNGEWIRSNYIKTQSDNHVFKWMASYTDYLGNKHQRSINLSHEKLIIEDTIDTTENAKIYFHLTTKEAKVFFDENDFKTYDQTQSFYSPYYFQRSSQLLLSKMFSNFNSLTLKFSE